MENEKLEQTLVLIKPDALKNSLTGYVLSQLSEFHTGLLFAGAKIVKVSPILAEEHYEEHKGKVFFPSLLEYIMGEIHYPDDPGKRRVKAFVFQGPDAVKKVRAICGPTNPHDARDKQPGCIRALGTLVTLKDEAGNIVGNRMDNLIHASANSGDAEREIKLWFKPGDIPPSMRAYETVICEEFIYYKNGKLMDQYKPGNICLFAPGDVAWKSDIDTLHSHLKGQDCATSVNAVAAKYILGND
jgi:nucleoside-diphosphate kinase